MTQPLFPPYPKAVLRAGLEARLWPRREDNPGYYEFESEIAHAEWVNDVRDRGIAEYASRSDLPKKIAEAMLESQIDHAKILEKLAIEEIWGDE